MKSVFSSLRYFIPAFVITLGVWIYYKLNPPPVSPGLPPELTVAVPQASPFSQDPAFPETPDSSQPDSLDYAYPAEDNLPPDTVTENPNITAAPPLTSTPPLTTTLPLTEQPSLGEFPIHFPFPQGDQNLVQVGTFGDRPEYLDAEAANAFQQMKAAAQKEGIDLIIISGFRTVAKQSELFQRQIERKGSVQAAAKLSAPPGFSEHHTGYTLDIGDGKRPGTVLKESFESTEAFRWLTKNAEQYGFELSFPRNNPQDVSYEPWHWRFVGTAEAQAIFQEARRLSANQLP